MLVAILLTVQTYAWHPLLNCRQKGVKLKLGMYIDEDDDVDEDREAIEANSTNQVGAAAAVDRPVLGM